MVNDLVTAISLALSEEFGDDTIVYAEAVEQGLQTPCFFISSLEVTSRLYMGLRYFCENPFCIQYIPDESLNAKAACNDVAEQLFSCLELITDTEGDLVRGTDMHYEIVDGVLNFFVNYDLFVYKTDEDDDTEVMEVLDQTSEVNE